jgi:hypothetical protein
VLFFKETMSPLDVITEVVANVVILGLVGSVSLAIGLPFVYFKRKRLLRFFGITRDRQEINVYLSTVFVMPGGSVDFKGTPRTFSGPAVAAAELEVINSIISIFNSPLLDGLPPSIRRWLGDNIHWTFNSISPFILNSPRDKARVKHGSIFTVGSQYYNSAAELYTETCNSILKMEPDGQTIYVRRGIREGDTFNRKEERDLAIVEKIFDDSTKSTVFLAGGFGVIGSKGAANYIVDNWEKLYKEFGYEPFAICLEFQNAVNDPNAYKRPIELSRFT